MPRGTFVRTEEYRLKLSESHKGLNTWTNGRKHTEETKRKMSEAHKGRARTEETKRKISASNTGLTRTIETRRKLSEARAGREITYETRRKLSATHQGVPVSEWTGMITPPNLAFRNSYKYKKWRRKVLERDNYTCVLCGCIGARLEADHIKPFSVYNGTKGFPDLRLDVNNGRTLCKPCHKTTDTYLNGAKRYRIDALCARPQE